MNPDFPVSPRRFPFFYGWWILVVSTVGVLASVPGQTVGVSVFNDSLIEATGLSRLSISNAYLAGTLASGLLLPWGGTVLDRFGARRTALVACFGLALTLFGLSHVDHLSGLDSHWTVRLILMGVLFFCLRFTGQGMLTMVSRTMLGRWFQRRRGLAAGLSGVFVGFGFGVAPQLFNWWIDLEGWRGAWREMALAIGIVMAGVVWLFYRNDPESCGLRMDGQPPPKVDEAPTLEIHRTRAEALRTLAFWAVTLALAFQALIITGITFHIVDLGAKVGLDRQESVEVFLPIAVVSTVVGLLSGIVADNVRIRTLVIVMMLGQALGIYAAMNLVENATLLIVGLGVSGGLFGPISTVAFPRFFGRAHLGSIAGFEMMLLVIGSALGPSLFAFSERVYSTYTPALVAALALPVVGLLLALRLREPAPTPTV